MTARGEDILAWTKNAVTEAERIARDAVCEFMYFDTDSEAAAAHYQRQTPESVLRRCAADRKLLDLHQGVPDHGRYSEPECPADCDGQHDSPPVCMSCRDYVGDPLEAPCVTVLAIAEGYGWTEGQR